MTAGVKAAELCTSKYVLVFHEFENLLNLVNY